jgi:hypothetical protein
MRDIELAHAHREEDLVSPPLSDAHAVYIPCQLIERADQSTGTLRLRMEDTE